MQSRVVDCLVEGKLSNQTCCAVSSSLLAHAPRVIVGCEAARTMYPGASQENAVRQSRICQHRGGLGARLDGKVNSGEPVINLVKHNRLKVLTSLNQNGMRQAVPLSHGNTRTTAPPGNNRTYAIVSTTRNTVSPYCCHVNGKANRKGSQGRCG